MSEIHDSQVAVQDARKALSQVEELLYTNRNRLHTKQNQLASALRQGQAARGTAQAIEQDIHKLKVQIDENLNTLGAARADLAQTLEAFPQLDRPWELVEHLNDNLPFLLFPVRIETRFMTVDNVKELWVRIFPDDIAVHTHEQLLTADEIKAGQTYWREIWTASQQEEDDKQQIEKGAWRALAAGYDGTRAAWIARETKPQTLDVADVADLKFPEFDPDTLKQESWSRAPRSNIMPDRFVVMGYADDQEIFRVAGNLIPNPLMMGPDPQKLEDEYQQQDGDLLVGEDIAWIYDFDRAIEIGMGLKIPLEEPFASQGVDRLLVLGLRLSSDEKENQTLLEELFENHHYAPDGFSLLSQGTPTNNTESGESGFSSDDPGAETSYVVETEDVLFEPTDESFEKTDGQRLVEALGISHEPLQRIQRAGQHDIREATLMNKALWQGTWGYYLEELLDLDPTTIERTREFFTDYVTGRGPLPAIRVGSQPYGILLTSDFSAWTWSRSVDGDRFLFLERLLEVGRKAEAKWQEQAPAVPHVGAPGDPYENLLSMLGLHATAVAFHRRHGVGKEYLWNFDAFHPSRFLGDEMMDVLAAQALAVRQELDFDFGDGAKLFDLVFFRRQDEIIDPLVDDILADEVERLSETRQLKSAYSVPDSAGVDANIETNYIGWLVRSEFDTLKTQRFESLAGDPQQAPRPLLYRMLRSTLLQTYYDATMRLYTAFDLLPAAARREVELSNIRTERTVTRWEFMDADVQTIPELNQAGLSIGQFLQTDIGLDRPEALSLREVRACLEGLMDLPTARLERIFVEHLDLCSYRLDAWQMGCFHRRLQQQRFPPGSANAFDARIQGIYLGAFGWVEDLRPAPELAEVDPSALPVTLHDPALDGSLFEQPDNQGFIHGPSINHAVAAAVLRNAYVTHFDPDNPEKMAVNLSSERVRTALSFLEGIRNGQELGALLGYQFERGLHDRHGDPSLNQYLPLFRRKYPLVADKITEDEAGEQIETKEARNMLDGYTLIEAAFLKEMPTSYPYGVENLPADPGSAHAQAIQAEVSRLADSLDAIADLALAESVFQVTQGNFERAGASLKAFSEGNNPPDPEIVRPPRSGAALTQRVTLHLDPGGDASSPWPAALSARVRMEPGLNRWLGDRLPSPDKIQYAIRLGDAAPDHQNLVSLGLQPIDLVYLIGDDLADESTELESRIAYENRRNANDDSLEISIEFMAALPDPRGVTLFALLPLLRALRTLVTGSRPLTADDFALPSETTSDPTEEPNPQGYDLDEMKGRVETAFTAFDDAVRALEIAIPDPDVDGNRDLTLADAEELRRALRSLAAFGVPDAVPFNAIGTSDESKSLLVNQAVGIEEIVGRKRSGAGEIIAAGNVTTLTAAERIARYREAAQEIFGPAFNAIPVFNLKNPAEMQAATDFRNADPALNLTRHHQENPHIVDEWLQGTARVREKVGAIETVTIFAEALDRASLDLKPLQLPFREKDYWVAVEYPEVYLFSVGLEFVDELDAGQLSARLREAFQKHNYSLTLQARVEVEENGSRWKIVDGDQEYLIQSENQTLNVYPEVVDNPELFLPEGDFLSLVQGLPTGNFDPGQPQSGLLIDEWTEVIPGRRETTGIATHYNQPSTEPPQALLLAVTPEVTGAWTWDKLIGTLNDTFDRSKLRAVEPDQLGDTALGHLLPSVVSAVTSYPFATISTDFVHESMASTLDLGSDTG